MLGFVRWHALRYRHPEVRVLLVAPAVADLLDGKRIETGFPDWRADVLVGRFLAGHLLTVSRRSAEGVDLERLEGVDEMWALCFRAPAPGWRLFGRFLARDVFVGLRAYDRIVLDGRATYMAYAADTIDDWRVFGRVPPVRSHALSDYLGGSMYRDVDRADEG